MTPSLDTALYTVDLVGKDTLVLTNELYVTPMIVGTAALMAVETLGGGRMAGFFTALGVTTLIRLLAIRFEWRLPRMNAGGSMPGGDEPGARVDVTPPEPGSRIPD